MEILAPVGNIQALYTAIKSGADAVYLGLDCFNARAKAFGFNRENIKEYIDLCHLYGVKVYITFNIAIKQSELQSLDEYVSVCVKAGADAFIVADLGSLDIFYKYNVPLHASTQMGVHNVQGAMFMKELGFSRVVVARETSKADIIEIKQKTGLEVEYFVHGALCVGFSGACLMSSMMSGDSGNRGRCNQPCRMFYGNSLSKKEGYLISPSEQCLLSKLDDLKTIGVDSLKIEGRLKQPYYVANVVGTYRKVVEGKKADEKDFDKLKRVFNRGEFTNGYMYDRTKDLMSVKVQNNIGIFCGKVVASSPKTIKIKAKEKLNDGDGLKILVDGKEVGGFEAKVLSAVANEYVLSVNTKYSVGAEVRKTYDSVLASQDYTTLNPIEVEFEFALSADKACLKAKCRGAEYGSSVSVQKAQNSPLTQEQVKESLSKLGGTNFVAKNIVVEMGNFNVFMPKSMLNNLRREVIEGLKELLLNMYDTGKIKCDYRKLVKLQSEREDKGFSLIDKQKRRIIINTDNFKNVELINDNRISVSYQIYDYKTIDFQSIINYKLIHNNCKLFLHLPTVVKSKEMPLIENTIQKLKGCIDGLICDNWYSVFVAKKYGLKAIGGHKLNIFNSKSVLYAVLDEFVYSPELTLSEIKDINLQNGYVYAYGLLPIMTYCHCPVQVCTGCDCGSCAYKGDFYYNDKKAQYLLKRTRLQDCYFELFNPAIVDISGKINKIDYNLYINMVNSKYEADYVMDCLSRGEKIPHDLPTTNAHLFRGVK